MDLTLDEIILSEMRVYTKIGLTAEERAYKQPIVIDLTMRTPPWRTTALRGDLSQSVCYSTAKQRVEELVTGKEWVLVEELAEDVARLLFGEFAKLREITIEIRKFVVPETSWAGVRVTRSREFFNER